MLFLPAPDYLRVMDDGTVKQLNPFSGTQVWTVAGRGNRPLQAAAPLATPVTPTDHTSACPFCSARQLETPPEKARLTRLDDGSWETRTDVLADELTTAP
ncbi:MAG: DUF4921 family protein, partial [Propionibacteriaceae bacterium]|nr:DUF4921 family protein [Propionibacteriaceae bacterium]